MRILMRTVQICEPINNPDEIVQMKMDGTKIRVCDVREGKFWNELNSLNKFSYRRFFNFPKKDK